jgi:hypothetical protein
LRAESRYPRLFDGIVTPDAAGKFVARNLPWTSYSVSFAGLPTSYYVKEIRYNNAPVPNASLTLFPGASLEIVLDDHPAAITGRVVNGDKPVPRAEILLSKWPPPPGPAMLEGSMFSVAMLANNDGLFRVGGLAPGEYRVAAFSAEASPQAIASLDLNGLLSRGEKVTLERGGQQTVQLKLIK